MPQREVTLSHTSSATQDVAYDHDNHEVLAGDWIVMPVRVTGIRIILDPETGEESHQLLEVSIVKPSGYNEHFRVLDARLCHKIEPPPEGHT